MSYPLVESVEGVFAYMQRQLEFEEQYAYVSPYVRHNFALLRFHAEKLARFTCACNGADEMNLRLIYEALAMTGDIDFEAARSLAELEQRTREELGVTGNDFAYESETETGDILAWADGLRDDFSAQLLAGASKRAIMEQGLKGAARIGAALGGPILMPYVEWILHRSVALGFKRLYFIARDGYILMRMAAVLIKKLNLDIEIHYIHGSRRAWRMPSYGGTEGELRGLVGWAHTHHIHSAEDLAEALQVPVEELRPYLITEYAKKGHMLKHEELNACVAALEKSEEFRSMLKDILSSSRHLAVDYLRQEIDVSDANFAFVELAGGGFTQICLARLMKDFYKGQVRTFFYKMDRVRRPDDECVFYNFFPSRLKNDLVVELVCRAPEGQTEGYSRVGDRVLPVKKNGEAELYKEKGYNDYIRGIDFFSKLYAESAVRFSPEPGIRASLACMDFISAQGDNEVLEFFAEIPNRLTGREDKIATFAPPLTKKVVQDMFIRYAGSNACSYYPGSDFEISVKRSTPYLQRKVAKYKKRAGEIRARWMRMFTSDADKNKSMHGEWQCPYSLLGRRVVLYGAGKRGQRWYKELSADGAIEVVQWLDKDYVKLKERLPVTGDMDSLGQVSFDWVMIDFADAKLLESVIEELQRRGVYKDKIYYPARISEWISGWINYLRV